MNPSHHTLGYANRQLLTAATATIIIVTMSGCAADLLSSRWAPLTCHAIPARRLPAELRGELRDEMVPVDFRCLGQSKPPEYMIGPGDVLGIYVRDVLESGPLAPVHYPLTNDTLYESPALGQPVRVRADGTIVLPDVSPIYVTGLTLLDATNLIRQRYVDDGVVQASAGTVSVDLIRPRTVNVVVLREDMGLALPILKAREQQLVGQRGSAHDLELPMYENDVLHALTASGGLPGDDAFNAVWILRRDVINAQCDDELESLISTQGATIEVLRSLAKDRPLTRIPLRVPRGAEPDIDPSSVVLNEGDIVYVESRERETFVAGGLLNGGIYPLPRDHDLDVFGAIAMASSNMLGPAGINAVATNFQAGPGNFVAPSRVIIVRMLPDGQQIKIHVDLRIAVNNPRERVTIQPGDVLLLKYRPTELVTNLVFNFVNFTYLINGSP